MTREELKQECVRRMHKLGIMPKVIGDFKKSFHKHYKSEFNGILYWLDEEEQRIVDTFEAENPDCIVYHTYKAHTNFGDMLYLFYVNENYTKEDYFDEDLESGIIFSYVHNFTDEWCSEFGSAYIKSINGGVQICY